MGRPPEPLATLLRDRLTSFRAENQGLEDWPAGALPRAIAAAHGASLERIAALLGGCALFFLAADIIDDAQDGDLPSGLEWPAAVNAGHSFLFAAMSAFAEAVPKGAVAQEIAIAGSALTWGQAVDLSATWDAAPAQVEALAMVRRKSGGSGSLFARMAALAADQPASLVDLWGKVGETMATAAQIRSDLRDLVNPDSRDLRQRKATLPVAFALARSSAAFLDAAGRGDAGEVMRVLRQSGAIDYAEFHIDALTFEAIEMLGTIGLTTTVRQDMADIISRVSTRPAAL